MDDLWNRTGKLLLGPLATAPEVVRTRLLATVLQSPVSLALTSFTLLMICTTAAGVSGARWAWSWTLLSALIVSWRLVYPLLASSHSASTQRVNIMLASGLLFVIFGLGCAMCILSGDLALTTMSLSGVFGIVAGLASRWAAIPRAAVGTMVLLTLPPVAALASMGGPDIVAAIAILLVVSSIAAFTVQNHHNLLAAITAEEHSTRLARTDSLTGLMNRAELSRRLESACARLTEHGATSGFAVLYLDLDGFKAVNDRHGHATGDELLRQVADRLREIVGPQQMIARIGGDEFIVLLDGADGAAASAVADRIIDRISRDHRMADGCVVRVGCSVGVSLAPHQGRDPGLLMARADAALYEVKNQGKGQSGLWKALG